MFLFSSSILFSFRKLFFHHIWWAYTRACMAHPWRMMTQHVIQFIRNRIRCTFLPVHKIRISFLSFVVFLAVFCNVRYGWQNVCTSPSHCDSFKCCENRNVYSYWILNQSYIQITSLLLFFFGNAFPWRSWEKISDALD